MSDVGKHTPRPDTGHRATRDTIRTSSDATSSNTTHTEEAKTIVRRGRAMTTTPETTHKSSDSTQQTSTEQTEKTLKKTVTEKQFGPPERVLTNKQTQHHLSEIAKHTPTHPLGAEISTEIQRATDNLHNHTGAESSSFRSSVGNIETGLRNGSSDAQINGDLAELKHANNLASDSTVVSRVTIGATKNEIHEILNKETNQVVEVSIKPASEADALYIRKTEVTTPEGETKTAYVVQIDEVKQSVRALAKKLGGTPEQLQNLRDWQLDNPQERRIELVVTTDKNWTDMFSLMTDKRGHKTRTDIIGHLIRENITVTIGSYKLDTQQLQKIDDLMHQEAIRQGVGTKISPKDFFAQYSSGLDTIQEHL